MNKLFNALCLATCTVAASAGTSIVVPNSLENSQGNGASAFPFFIQDWLISSMRFQQVYDGTQFSAINTPGQYIIYVIFRPDRDSGGVFSSITNIQINLSTTLRGSDALSPIFSENIGTNDTVVYGPRSLFFGGSTTVALDTPFFYDPAQGNLLLDVRNFTGGDRVFQGKFPSFDAASVTNDSVSVVYGTNVNASLGQSDTSGLVTMFSFVPVPELKATRTNDSVAITWPTQPRTFILQSADSAGTRIGWQSITNGIS